jgi:hypothetical protein
LHPAEIDEYYRNYLSDEVKLYIFGKQVFSQLILHLIEAKDFQSILYWKSKLPS